MIEWPAFYPERVSLETVLRNLIGNAIKHHDHPREGVVEVAAVVRSKWVEFPVMGLAIAKKVVESQGGWLQVESQTGQGATFRFGWPKAAGE